VIGSVCTAAFFHRGIIPLLTLFFSASGSQKTAVTLLEEGQQMPSGLPPPAGGSVPWRPSAVMRNAEPSFPHIVSHAGHKFVLNPCRKAHRNYSLFPIHYSLSTRPTRRHTAPRQSRPTSRDCQGIAPRRGALTSWARSLSRLRACEFGMSADFERELLPAGAGGFPISWGYDKISAGAVGARFYTNKSGAKENHLCRELWVWPGRPLQNMI